MCSKRNDIDYMRYSLNTGCKTCDGTGYLLEGIVPCFGDASGNVEFCPDCNKAGVMPRNVCNHCKDRRPFPELPPLGNLVRGSYLSFAFERWMPINKYLCDQCIGYLKTDGANIRILA